MRKEKSKCVYNLSVLHINTFLEVHPEVHSGPVEALPDVLLLLQSKHVLIKKLLQFLIAKVDANLLESIKIKYFKSSDIQDSNVASFLHVGVDESLVTFLHNKLECSLVERPGNAGHGAGGLRHRLTLRHPLSSDLQLGF